MSTSIVQASVKLKNPHTPQPDLLPWLHGSLHSWTKKADHLSPQSHHPWLTPCLYFPWFSSAFCRQGSNLPITRANELIFFFCWWERSRSLFLPLESSAFSIAECRRDVKSNREVSWVGSQGCKWDTSPLPRFSFPSVGTGEAFGLRDTAGE